MKVSSISLLGALLLGSAITPAFAAEPYMSGFICDPNQSVETTTAAGSFAKWINKSGRFVLSVGQTVGGLDDPIYVGARVDGQNGLRPFAPADDVSVTIGQQTGYDLVSFVVLVHSKSQGDLRFGLHLTPQTLSNGNTVYTSGPLSSLGVPADASIIAFYVIVPGTGEHIINTPFTVDPYSTQILQVKINGDQVHSNVTSASFDCNAGE